jgi:hypothetical protein
MVAGIDKFREHFAGYEDRYAIIGGAACDLLFDAAGLPFRATKDIDMVLCIEVVDVEFANRFGAFLDAGGYQAREKSDGKKEFYRFHKPTDDAYPFMIELFARMPGTLTLPEGSTITRIPVDEDVLSLSAILLDDGYYEALQTATREINGVTILDETLLIPFKVRAFLDLSDRQETGENVDRKNIRKHRGDVFRLLQLLPGNAAIKITEPIREDMRRFVELMESDTTLDLKSLGVRMTSIEAIALLRSAYGLGCPPPLTPQPCAAGL